MKKNLFKLATVIALSCGVTSCNINDDYDLSNMGDATIGLGNSESRFELPLATVEIDLDGLFGVTTKTRSSVSSDFNADALLVLFNNFLPSDLSVIESDTYDYSDGIDLTQIEDTEYMTPVVDALIVELQTDETKREEFCYELIYNEVLESDSKVEILNEYVFIDTEITETELEEIQNSEDADAMVKEVSGLLKTTLDDEQLVGDLTSQIVTTVTTQDLGDVIGDGYNDDFSVDDVSIDQSVIDMLSGADNLLDICIYYRCETNLSIGFTLDIYLKYDGYNVLSLITKPENFDLESNKITSKEQLESILSNLHVEYSIDFNTYTPSDSGLSGKYLKLYLMASKKGALVI